MKKILLFILILSFITLPSCFFTDVSDVIFTDITGSGSYDSTKNLSTLSVYFKIENNNLIQGELSTWVFSLISDREYVDIISMYLQETYRWYLCEDVDCNNLYISDGAFHVKLEITKKGDIFKGKDPNKIEIQVLIKDENDNSYSVKEIRNFEFIRI